MKSRRHILGSLASAAALGAVTWPARGSPRHKPVVVVIGGGFGGCTAAKYLRIGSGHAIDVILVEPEAAFVSCPMSNRVVCGDWKLAQITRSFAALSQRHGIELVRDHAVAIDAAAHTVALARGRSIHYDKLVLATGVDLVFDVIEGLEAARDHGRILQAWTPGPESASLFAQLSAMRDGGVFAITVPELPFRCPAAPYERACLVADYLRRAKPRSKVLVLDANDDVVAGARLFKTAWSAQYGDMIEYRPQHLPTAVDAATGTIRFEVQEEVKADVLNVLPPMRAGRIAREAGLARANARWCEVDFLDFESTSAQDIHIVGDAIQTASMMPKSGHMANSHAKIAAAAIVAQLAGRAPDPSPTAASTCYSFVNRFEAIHIASVHRYDPGEKTFVAVAGAGSTSTAPSALEARAASTWAQHIWADCLG